MNCSLNNVSSLAGGGYGYRNGLGTIAFAKFFSQIGMNSFDEIIATDVINHCIRRIERITSTPPERASKTSSPTPTRTCKADSASNYFVTTFAGSSTGSTDGLLGNALFNNPGGIAINSEGNIFISDSANRVIRFINVTSGTVSTIAGSLLSSDLVDGQAKSEAKFLNPKNLCLLADGTLVILDNPYIRKLDPARQTVITLMSGGEIRGIYCDIESEDIWIADSDSDTIYTISSTGALLNMYGSGISGYIDGHINDAQFYDPSGIAKDRFGNVYIGDGGNRLIRILRPDNTVVTLAGQLGSNERIDGPASTALVGYPYDFFIDNQGDLIFAQSSTNCNSVRIRINT